MIEKPSGDIDKIDLDKVDWRGSREFFESLGEALDKLDDKDESYDFTWVGKRKAIIEAGAPINKTLRPDVENSKNWETTENLFIEGDNLDALKLLQESYLGKIKMIYIDPPYNTGKDFVYHDNFKTESTEWDENTEYKDEAGNIQFKKNEKTNGRYHSDWLSMMYPRLKLARNLLTDDGVIFLSIDDNEQANLKKLCDEIFGEDNFVAAAPRLTSPQRFAQEDNINISHDLILIYKKSELTYLLKIPQTDSSNKSLKTDNIGDYYEGDTKAILAPQGQGYSAGGDYDFEFNGKLYKPVDSSGKRNRWFWTKERMETAAKLGILRETNNSLRMQIYQNKKFEEKTNIMVDKEVGLRATTYDLMENTYSNPTADSELSKIEMKGLFSYPKPVALIDILLRLGAESEDIVLDFFSGSSSTAHAVMQLNAKDGGNRKWIMVQLTETTDEKSEAYKAGYRTIPEISRERIRRAGDKIAAEHPDAKVDYGFRALKIADTNYKEVYKSAGEYEQSTLLEVVDNIKDDRTELDLLYGVLTQSAFELNRPLETRDIAGATVYLYDYFGEISGLVACFASSVPEETIKAIAKLKPLTAVFRDSSFADSQAKVNLAEHFRILSPETKVKVI